MMLGLHLSCLGFTNKESFEVVNLRNHRSIYFNEFFKVLNKTELISIHFKSDANHR
jgi:hypothetical protein